MLVLESFPLLWGEQSEVLIIKLTRVVAFDLPAILQSNGPRLELLGFTMIPSLIVLMFAILVLLGSCLLDPSCVFIIIIVTIWVPSDNVLLDVSHGLKMSAPVWLIFGSLNDNQVDVIQIWVFDFLEQRSDLHLFRVAFCTVLSSHNRM